jgi:hypothetical protein
MDLELSTRLSPRYSKSRGASSPKTQPLAVERGSVEQGTKSRRGRAHGIAHHSDPETPGWRRGLDRHTPSSQGCDRQGAMNVVLGPFARPCSTEPLSSGQRPAKRGGRNLRWDTQRTQGTTSVGFMEQSRSVQFMGKVEEHDGSAHAAKLYRGCARYGRGLAQIPLPPLDCSIKPTGCTSVAREFTGTDRPRVNPECRTHGPRGWVGSGEQGGPLGVETVLSCCSPCQPTAGVLPCSSEPTPKPRQARKERGSKEHRKDWLALGCSQGIERQGSSVQERRAGTSPDSVTILCSFELLSVSVGFPSRPGGQGRIPGCIPSS